jgi:uncharacterized protein (UPF0335 family)
MSDTPTAGHNSVAVDQLRAFVERVKTLRKIVAMRKMDREKLLADKAMLDLYADALGIFG